MGDPYSHRPRVGITLSYRVGGDPHTPACDPHLPPCAPLRAHWSVRVRPSIAFLLCRPPCLPALSPSFAPSVASVRAVARYRASRVRPSSAALPPSRAHWWFGIGWCIGLGYGDHGVTSSEGVRVARLSWALALAV